MMIARRIRRWMGYAAQLVSDLKWHRKIYESDMPTRTRRIFEQARLLVSSGINGEDYYNHGLYRADMPFPEKVRFLGYYKKTRYFDVINLPVYDILARDKVLFQLLATALDLPVPTLCAVTRYESKPVCGRRLNDLNALEDFLREPDSEQLFFKPADSSLGEGALSLGAKIPGQEAWKRLPGGEVIVLEDVIKHVQKKGEMRRFVIQKRLRPHPMLAEIIPDVCSTLRIMTYTLRDSTFVLGVSLRFGNGREATDTISGGGVVVAVDIATGLLGEVVSLEADMPKRFSTHPMTGVRITGKQVPGWPEIIELVKSAAAKLSFIPCIGWDIGVTDDGPVIVEINSRPRCRPIQLANDRGILSGPFLDALLDQDGTVNSGLNLRNYLG